jgi:bifunctional DNA-binding transcriptional regulator/antitoxin component of YhaV-PrlF toxin-antitoxin module
VVPKALRDQVGLRPGAVEVLAEGNVLRIEPVSGEGVEERRGRLVIPAAGSSIGDADVRALRDVDQR